MVNLTINGKAVEAPQGATVLQAAESAGIIIPTLCYHKDLSPFGGCRLCLVEVQGFRIPVTACNLPVTPGMAVQTETPALVESRRSMLRMLLRNYYDAGYTRSNGTFAVDLDSEFAHWVQVYGIDLKSVMAKRPRYPVDSDPNPYVWVDWNKCILCMRCVRACAEVQGRFVWSQAYRGGAARIVAGADGSMLPSRCESCGACVAYCPTGALDNKMSVGLGRASRMVTTTCPYCGVGCQLTLNVKDDRPGGSILRVTSDPQAPVNGMHLCVKGRYGYEFIHHPDRLVQPRVRQYLLEGSARPRGTSQDREGSETRVIDAGSRGKWVEVDWDTALNITAASLRAARDQRGPDSVGLLASGRLLNEEIYLLNKLARQVLGTNNIDSSACVDDRCAADELPAMASPLEDIGAGRIPVVANTIEHIASGRIPAMTSTIADIAEKARAIFIIGSDITEEHPVFGAYIRQAILRRGARLVVASPVFVNIEEYAGLTLRYSPGTETILINGLIHIILEKGWQAAEVSETRFGPAQVAELKRVAAAHSPAAVAERTGVPVEALYQAAEILAAYRPMAVIWGTGGTHYADRPSSTTALANLQILLGNLGYAGGGLAPLRSQSNSQGARDMGALPGLFPGYQPVASRPARYKFEAAWGTELPQNHGLAADAMIAAAANGQLQALYILAEDLINTENGVRTRRALEACPFVVVQEILPSETARYADVLLPGVSFAEKAGTCTNTERRVQMVHQAIQPVGASRPDWQIIAELARRILAGDNRASQGGHGVKDTACAGWEYRDTAQIMAEIAALTPIYAGISHERLERDGGLFWPV